MTNIPTEATHYQLSNSGEFIQNFFKFEGNRWHRWSEWETWRDMTDLNEKGKEPDKAIPIEQLSNNHGG